MVVTEKKTFVYGNFIVLAQKPGARGRNPLGGVTGLTPPPGYSPYAIEILREFSPSEFIGKVYQLSGSLRWEVLDPANAKGEGWYRTALKRSHDVKFEMQDSGQWTVQNVRIESDDQGRYVAAALSNK